VVSIQDAQIHPKTMWAFLILGSVSSVSVWTSPGGNDLNPGSQQSPFATVSRAYQFLLANGSEDNSIYMVGGTYTSTSSFQLGIVNVSFVPVNAAAVEFLCTTGSTFIGTGVPTGTKWRYPVNVSFANDITFQNCMTAINFYLPDVTFPYSIAFEHDGFGNAGIEV